MGCLRRESRSLHAGRIVRNQRDDIHSVLIHDKYEPAALAVATESSQESTFQPSINSMTVGRRATTGCCSPLSTALANNFTVLANYTWSHCIGDSQADELTAVTYLRAGNRKADRGGCYVVDRQADPEYLGRSPNAKFSDHMLRVMASGWQLSTIVSAQTGPSKHCDWNRQRIDRPKPVGWAAPQSGAFQCVLRQQERELLV